MAVLLQSGLLFYNGRIGEDLDQLVSSGHESADVLIGSLWFDMNLHCFVEKEELAGETNGAKQHMEFIHQHLCHRRESYGSAANQWSPLIVDVVYKGVTESTGNKAEYSFVQKLLLFLVSCNCTN